MGLNWKPEAQQAGNGRVPRGLQYMAAWAYLVSPSELRGRRSFVHRLRLDLKTPIKKVPWRFAKGGGGETQNHETKRQKAAAGEDRRGETPPESPPEGSTPLRRVHHQHLQQELLHHHHHDEGGVVHPWTRVCGGNFCISPLSWASLISTVWAAEHDYGHLCNTFVVNIVVWDDLLCIYRCVGAFVICHTLKYDVCGYGMADVTRHRYWVTQYRPTSFIWG